MLERVSIALALIVLCLVTAKAQSGQAELTGQIHDQNGAAIANAQIKVTSLATNQTVNAIATEEGTYTVTNLKPGLYSIAVDATGFKQTLREQIKLSTGERVRVDVILEPGTVSESVMIKD